MSSKRYPEEFKIEAVKQVTEKGRSESHYCMKCAEAILKSSLLKINGLIDDI